ncbi:MAG: T9SS type A sorting domain-containing protein [bacterium]
MKYRFYLIRIITLLLIILISPELNAQLRLKIRKVTDEGFTTTDPWQYPIMKARIRAEVSGTPVKLSSSNVLIMENNKISKPIAVEDFVVDTTTGELWQMVKWYTRREGPNLSSNNMLVMTDTFYVFTGNEIAKIAGWHNRGDLSFVKMHNSQDQTIIEKGFISGDPGSSQAENIIVKALKGQIDGSGTEGQIWIDSAKVHTSNFRIKWDGWSLDKRPPPLHIWPMMPYFVRLYYEPKDNGYHTDKLTVYYDHGLKQEIMLTGHEFHIQDEANNLKLLTPNGGEVLTPCEEIEIKWNGYIRGMSTYIDFSSNNGSSWTNIGIDNDSSFIWKVPNISTSSALIRVRQSFNSTNPALLKLNDTPVYKVNFNYDGSRLLAANEAGTVTMWNTVTEKAVKSFYIDEPNYPGLRIRTAGLSYISSDTLFAIAFYRLSDYPRRDSIAFFHVNDSIPYSRKAIEQGFNTAEVRFDNKKRFIAFVSEMGMKVKIYSAQDGRFIRDLTYSKPVSAFVFNRELDQAAVALMDGEIQILSLPDFTLTNTIDYSDFPLVLEMSLASNGDFLAIGSKSPYTTVFSDNRNDIFVVNIPTKQVIRRFRRTASDPVALEFSPVSTKLLIGSQDNPQISYWDLPVDEGYVGFKGHNGKLTDFGFSPRGSMIATSSISSDNLYLRRFAYAESDESDNHFRIITPSLAIENVQIPSAFISENVSYKLSTSICVRDSSLVYLSVDSVSMKNRIHFRLSAPLPKDTIILAGECLTLNMNYSPLDTGLVSDSIVIYSCGSNIYIPLNSSGKMRNIRLLNTKFTFDKTCVGSSAEKTFAIAINDDPVPLFVNSHEFIKVDYNPFISLTNRDMTYQPGDTIFATIKFEPTEIGVHSRQLVITHSNLPKFQIQVEIIGEAIGTDYELSHYDLRFIPEILNRKITIINNSDNPIYIYETNLEPEGFFTVNTTLPINIEPRSKSEIEIAWNNWMGEPPYDVNLKLSAGPCAAEKNIVLGLYKANSRISIPDVFADPKGSTTINIDFDNAENHPYNGQRFFEGEITINPRLFLPQKVSSPFGSGEVTKNEIFNDRRIIGFRVKGDFPKQGRVAEIHGIAGLAEIDTSHIRMTKVPIFWGTAVNNESSPGIYNLINICGNRLVIHGNIISDLTLSPNPTNGKGEIRFESQYAGEAFIEIFNSIGLLEQKTDLFRINEGKNSISVDFNNLKSGTYSMILREGHSYAVIKVIVIR